ncbi:MAG TPA: M20/M25/M40 family metallo-hydrolase [Gemmatimonadaceae bacterium]|nr:M20/M25/M40 family metallo-hydrolase [Gemmatimonadaceae bacterium]
MTRSLFIGSLLALFALPAAAQQYTSPDPVIRAIWNEGMDNSQLPRMAQALLDSVGPRLTGSPGMKAGNDWLVKTYASWGVTARNEQYGTWPEWRRGISHIDLLTPRVRSLEGGLLAWSPGTGGRDVTGPAIVLPPFSDSAAFEAWLPQVRGKFVLISFAEPTCRPNEQWQALAAPGSYERMDSLRTVARTAWTERVRRTGFATMNGIGAGRLGRRLGEAGAAAVITSRWDNNGWGTRRIFGDLRQVVPAIDLSCEDYGLVFRLAERNQGPTLRLRAESEMRGEQPVFNTIAEIRGSEKPNEYVMLSAHFDSWDGSSGATDNGTGTLVMLEAVRLLKKAYPTPKRTILVGHWSGEEQGINGSRAWAQDHPEVVRGLQALFNQDDGTGRIVNLQGGGLLNAGSFLARWLARIPNELTRNIQLSVPGTPSSGGSDNAAFACYGAPGFGLGASDWGYGPYTWHTNRDTYDKIVFDDLMNNATLTAMLVYLASEDPEMIPRDQRSFDVGTSPAATALGRGGRGGRGGGRGGRGGTAGWPACTAPLRSAGAYNR